jgi:hypothetical protein
MKTTTWKATLTPLILTAVFSIGALVMAAGPKGAPAQSCPGPVVCPLTGETICSLECPLKERP